MDLVEAWRLLLFCSSCGLPLRGGRRWERGRSWRKEGKGYPWRDVWAWRSNRPQQVKGLYILNIRKQVLKQIFEEFDYKLNWSVGIGLQLTYYGVWCRLDQVAGGSNSIVYIALILSYHWLWSFDLFLISYPLLWDSLVVMEYIWLV